MKGSGRGVI